MIDTEHYKQKLLALERELTAQADKQDENARESDVAEVEDLIDQATSDQSKSTAFELESSAFKTLEEVRDALQRIKDGSYGVCAGCGRPIEAARLEAVPWARYCLADQEKRDSEAGVERSNPNSL